MPFTPSNEALMDISRRYEESYDPRMDWSEEDWRHAATRAMRPETRQVRGYDQSGQPSRLHEYLVGGKWYSQQEYDDPLMQRNIFNPWREEVQNRFRLDREALEKKRQAGPGQFFERRRGPERRGGGRVGSRAGGGFGGGGFDENLIAAMIGG